MSADHGSVAKELERANEEFKEFERKDIKYREDLKHVKAKLKKLQEKLTKDSAKMQVGSLASPAQTTAYAAAGAIATQASASQYFPRC